jgi:hypothetical protein
MTLVNILRAYLGEHDVITALHSTKNPTALILHCSKDLLYIRPPCSATFTRRQKKTIKKCINVNWLQGRRCSQEVDGCVFGLVPTCDFPIVLQLRRTFFQGVAGFTNSSLEIFSAGKAPPKMRF